MLIGTKSDLKDSTDDEWKQLRKDEVIREEDYKNPITIREGIYRFKCNGICVCAVAE